MQGVVFVFLVGWLAGLINAEALRVMSRQQQEGCIKRLFAAGKD